MTGDFLSLYDRSTRNAGLWRNSQHLTAAPELPLLRLAAHFIPPWSGIGRFKPDFARTLRPGWLTVSASNLGHVADRQILNDAIAWFLLTVVVTL
ncbi:hypothetical protein JYY64_004434 [Salmonella enterica subsp. houtenae serovar 50:g,z51:-]|nr:hypothetical protein [Salmonella enterica subsp. houtenae serovar 50:g,z51:-]